jgi:hypothetical protein
LCLVLELIVYGRSSQDGKTEIREDPLAWSEITQRLTDPCQFLLLLELVTGDLQKLVSIFFCSSFPLTFYYTSEYLYKRINEYLYHFLRHNIKYWIENMLKYRWNLVLMSKINIIYVYTHQTVPCFPTCLTILQNIFWQYYWILINK